MEKEEILKKIMDNLSGKDKDTIDVAYAISKIAHSNQKRENGYCYAVHPIRVALTLEKFLKANTSGFGDDGYVYDRFLDQCEIPSKGLVEAGLLHDVMEDTELTNKDIYDVFASKGHEKFYIEYIDTPLRIITHDKNEDYETYIKRVLTNPTAALVKMADLNDNLNIFDLNSLTLEKYNRSLNYLRYIKMINDKYHFIENAQRYRESVLGWIGDWSGN